MRSYITGNGSLPDPHFILKGNITTIKSLEDDVKELLKEMPKCPLLMIDGKYFEWIMPNFKDFEEWVLLIANDSVYQVVVVTWSQ